MKRFLAFAGALALAAVQPAVTLAAHPGGGAVSRPAAPIGHPVAPGGFANQAPVNVPFHVNVQALRVEPPLRVEPQHFTIFHPVGFSPQAMVSPYLRYAWRSAPAYSWYPAFYGSACNSSNNLFNTFNTSSQQMPADMTIGSLVDGKSNLFSSQSFNGGYASATSLAAAPSNPFALQVQFFPTACGAPGFTSF